jgi:hypothetical protein
MSFEIKREIGRSRDWEIEQMGDIGTFAITLQLRAREKSAA